jgi:ligand-binding sensor protein
MKTLYITLGILFAIISVGVLLFFMKKEKESIAKNTGSDNTTKALIDEYDSITDVETKKIAWAHVFKTCPYYKGYIESQALRWDRTLEEQISIEVDFFINKGRNPKDYMPKCNEKFIDTSRGPFCAKLENDIRHMHWCDKAAKKKKQEQVNRYCR